MSKRSTTLFLIYCAAIALVLSAIGTPAVQAGKPRVAVIDFDSEERNFWSSWRDHKNEVEFEVNALFMNELVKSGQFTVIERQRLDDILKEQGLSLTGQVSASSAVQAGKLLGVDYMLTGRITKFGERQVGGNAGWGIALSAKKKTLEGGLSVRLINTTTGEIVFADEATGEDSNFKVNIFGTGGGVDYDQTAVDKVFRPAVEELSRKLIDKAGGLSGSGGDRPAAQGKISKISGDLVYLNMGDNKGVKVGDTFTVYALGEEIIDPDTGESLGAEETEVGKVEVVEVKAKYSKARVTSGSGMTAGSAVR
jgi:curli biogenesis system outer membrane secretion channel CsgG